MSMTMSDMSMSGMDMASSTMAMASATATSSMDMGDTDMSGHSGSAMVGMSEMMMVFFTSTGTPLLSEAWTPSSVGQYAGTCIFLIALSFVLRSLIALRVNFNALWAEYAVRNSADAFQKSGSRGGCQTRRPWRINEAATRALLDTVLAGVSYLLMLAVMTMNLGYFLSVLGGVFLGSFVTGAWTSNSAAVH